uniref:Si:dkey-205h13.2 n=1 Tax=Sinocyclocheilus anshuiensis TaxID=1608454 RepID=A0A671K2S3_9TELE
SSKFGKSVTLQSILLAYDPIQGFACVNKPLNGWWCQDDPNGLGDNEKLSLLLIRYPLQVCAQPIAIEVTTVSGINIFVIFCRYDPLKGFECVNGACQDYRVCFTCPLSFCNTTCVTRWFDSDDPETNGRDSELLSGLFSKYPGYICPNPIGIEVQTISGQPAYQTGNIFQVYNPVFGFACVTAGQTGGGLCADYKVRFSCPEKFCTSE